MVARVVLQDFTGVPLLVDLAAMRSTVSRLGRDAGMIEPLVPVDLVVDHSVQVDFSEVPNALQLNMEMEFKRNRARYQFLKWGMQAFNGFSVVPPGIGIIHQVNLEYLAKGVLSKDEVYYPDTLVGTDSHTTMINGLGIVGWGVGGIEAEAGMLGQPVYFLTPDVVGVNLTGALEPGVTATDLVLTLTEMLRKAKVVGKFVEFHGAGAASLGLTDRATIANMAPEYGATMGFFPVDEESCRYLAATGRTETQVDAFRQYFKAQGLFGMPEAGQIAVQPAFGTGPGGRPPLRRRPQAAPGPDRPAGSQGQVRGTARQPRRLQQVAGGPEQEVRHPDRRGAQHQGHFGRRRPGHGDGPRRDRSRWKPANDTAGLTEVEMMQNRPTPDRVEDIPHGEFPEAMVELSHGDVVIAAITSCTNTANPSLMLAAGLVAKKAVEKGMTIRPTVKTSLAPGSRVVTEYLDKTGLSRYLDRLGFQTVGYGCTTCIGNSGPLEPHLEKTVTQNDLVVASVLSGNRNFEARVHQNVRANFLMSPPLVVAFALAGTVDVDMNTEPIGKDKFNADVYLKDLWPTAEEIGEVLSAANDPETYQRLYKDFAEQNPLWQEIPSSIGQVYEWDASSTYIREPPYFDKFSMEANVSKEHPERPAPGDLRRFGDDRPHQPRRGHQADLAGGPVLAAEGRSRRGLQLLRVAPGQPPDHDARDVRQRPHPEPDGAGRRRRHDHLPARRRGDEHLRRLADLPRPGRPADDLRRPGIRHRLVARLGRQGDQPCWASRPSSRSRSSASTAPTSSAWASCPASSRRGRAHRPWAWTGPRSSTWSAWKTACGRRWMSPCVSSGRAARPRKCR